MRQAWAHYCPSCWACSQDDRCYNENFSGGICSPVDDVSSCFYMILWQQCLLFYHITTWMINHVNTWQMHLAAWKFAEWFGFCRIGDSHGVNGVLVKIAIIMNEQMSEDWKVCWWEQDGSELWPLEVYTHGGGAIKYQPGFNQMVRTHNTSGRQTGRQA